MKPVPKKPSPIRSDTESKPVRKAVITTIAGFVALLVGLHLEYGVTAVLIVGGVAAVLFGLLWEPE